MNRYLNVYKVMHLIYYVYIRRSVLLLFPAFQIIPSQCAYLQRRFKVNINFKKEPVPHYQRRLVEAFLTPYYVDPKKDKTPADLCSFTRYPKTTKECGPYEKIIAREVRNWFDNSTMVGIFHRNSMNSENQLELQIALKKLNMYYKSYGPTVLKEAFLDSPYAPVNHLVTPTSFGLIFSPESDVKGLEKIVKKYPQLILLAGILEGRLLSRNDFLKYGKSDITTERVGLLQTLQTAGGNNLNRQLTHHQTTLVSRLRQIGTKDSNSAETEIPESA